MQIYSCKSSNQQNKSNFHKAFPSPSPPPPFIFLRNEKRNTHGRWPYNKQRRRKEQSGSNYDRTTSSQKALVPSKNKKRKSGKTRTKA
jgi:hypothetical protein